MRVLFVIDRLDFADHISIAYLSAIAKQAGHDTYLCNLSDHIFLDMIHNIAPDVVAFSANIVSFKQLVHEHKMLEKRLGKLYISIMGGPQPTISPETFKESGMDVYCIGEGEYAFRDFLERVDKNEPFDDVPNLITKNKVNSVRPTIRNLDELPMPDRDLTLSNSYLKTVPKKTFYATRGCPFRCTYCCNSYYHKLYKGKGPLARRFSVDRVIKEIKDVGSKYRMDYIKFGDDLFAMKADDWLKEFAERYRKEVNIPFNCYLRFDRVDDEIASLLNYAGCHSVHLSVDSTSEFIREKILNRQMKKVDIVNTLRMIKAYNMETWVNFMLALPESTLQDDLDSIEVCRKANVTFTSFCTTDPMVGTELYSYCVKKGYISKEYKGDMTNIHKISKLSCFSGRDKRIRYNILFLGPMVATLPNTLYKLGMILIKYVPPNYIFRLISNWYYRYVITHKIFRLPTGEMWRIRKETLYGCSKSQSNRSV